MTIKNKKKILKILDDYFHDHKKFNMPSFSKSVNKSIFFKKNYNEIKKLIEKKNKTLQDSNKLDELILCSYFSSTVFLKSIKKYENKELKTKPLKSNNLFDRSKKKIYLKI